LKSQPTKSKYPYETVDDDGRTPVVVMTIEQANAINKKFRDMQSIIKMQTDTITKYEQKVVFVEVSNTQKVDSLSKLVTRLSLKVDSIQYVADTTYKWADELNLTIREMAAGPSLLYTIPPYNYVYFINLDDYNMFSIDRGDIIQLVKMTKKEYEELKQLQVKYNQMYYPTIDYFKGIQFKEFEKELRLYDKKIWKNKNLLEKQVQD